ncbi:MAG: glutamate synthase large subunit [Gemmatimonadetes bacterium]|nr:glutamate synthase large subunit [Gemmatimonadota bacterium]
MPTYKAGAESPFPLYNPAFEHDGCGTGFIADIAGRPSHRIVQLAVEACVRVTHRGAVSADASSGDGAGVTIQLPRELLAKDAAAFGLPATELHRLAVAMVFLPVEPSHLRQARLLLEDAATRSRLQVLGWREVPIDPSRLGGLAKDTLPGIEQLLLARPKDVSMVEFERALYLARKRAEAAYREHDLEVYIVSMSSRTVVYKGLMVAPQLEAFFPDLADERTVSSLALFHQRFATNTLPNWKLAQPFRMLGHNGEINTLVGNRNWMKAREQELTSPVWGDELPELLPVIWPGGSDSASLDEVLELLVTSGRDVLHAIRMLVPDAWENDSDMDPQLKAFYEYHACLIEPWDGPGNLALTDGVVAAAAMDRNGLRPARYKVTRDGLVVCGSEVGIVGLPLSDVVEAGRVGPGEMIAVDTERRQFLRNEEIKRRLSRARPYTQWVEGNVRRVETQAGAGRPSSVAEAELSALQVLHGYTREELKLVLTPMAEEGKEPTGSMGDDSPPSVLTEHQRLLYTYFRQRFAQVTNPAIDSIRERIVMSLDMYIGTSHCILEERPEAARLLHLLSPLLSDETFEAMKRSGGDDLTFATLPATFPADSGPEGMMDALDDLCRAAIAAVEQGHCGLIISDRIVGSHQAPIPMLLAVASVHHHLIRTGRRMGSSLVAEAGDARDVHHFAALIGFGASAVNPYLALASVRALAAEGELGDVDGDKAVKNFLKASEAGLLKILSKMGISTVSSYHCSQIFEALGLADEVIDYAFTGTTSRIGGIGFADIAKDVVERHQRAFTGADMEAGGWHKYKKGSEYHANEPPVWRALHAVVEGGGDAAYKAYTDLVYNRPPTALRDLLRYASDRKPIPVDRVEATSEILRRFQTGAMSLGALSRETHEDIARAMNKIGGRANTGEGGEDPRRYSYNGDLRDANSVIKQVASGRFGVTPAYLAGAEILEIKISQGSKPGEGGQLPGHKVSPYIAELRHVLPGTPLISPPPHHDIYSIEDLAQLIYDLKMANPDARVCVKLVASEGVGTIAAGVAKAYADAIQISGCDGGTGASPLSSVKYAGDPWELGLAETQQTLVLNGLRGRVEVITDGGLHAGRDIVTGAMLGADRFGFGTTALIALGCKMARQCHLNTCPVGIATQAEELRKKYFGTPEMLITFLTHVAEEVRQILAELGYERLEDIIGRADLLEQIPAIDTARWRGIDLTSMITPAPGSPKHCVQQHNDRPDKDDSLDDRIIAELGDALETGRPFKGSYAIENTDRTVGGRISVRASRTHADAGLPPHTIDLTFTGSAGQTFGGWLLDGVHLTLIGEANDYVGKGMHGGEIVIRPPQDAGFRASDSTLAGNTVLYGATGGSLFLSGRAGERFAVRNSGAVAVVEGVGDHGCEYMTAGMVAVLGCAGRNFGAGMSGGVAFVLDQEGTFPDRLNRELVSADRLTDPTEIQTLKSLVERHLELTGSERAKELLGNWSAHVALFWKVSPKLGPGGVGATTSDATATSESVDTAVGLPQGMRPRVRRHDGGDGGLQAPPPA